MRSGQVGQVSSGRSGQVMLVRPVQVGSGQSGQVRPEQVRSGQVGQVKSC